MKKNTLSTIIAALNTVDFENKDVIMTELDKELNRGADERAAKKAEYNDVHDIVIGALSDTPITINELYESIEADLPSNFSRNKVQYGVTRMWADEVVKIEGKPNTYKRA